MDMSAFVQSYGSVIIALVTLIVTVLYTSLTRKMIKTEERHLAAQKRIIEDQRTMFATERTPYLVFEHKAFNVGYQQNSARDYFERADTYFTNASKVRISYCFEDFRLSCEDAVIAEMSPERQARLRYILPGQERHHFCIMEDRNFEKNIGKYYYFEYTLVYDSCEDVHTVRYKSRRKIRFKPEAYDSADQIYLRWSVLSEYDGPYDQDPLTDND
jgi:hypothetical protein